MHPLMKLINYFVAALMLSFLILECTEECPDPIVIMLNGIFGIMNLLFGLEEMLKSIVPKIKMQLYEVDRSHITHDSIDNPDDQDSSVGR
jgi:TctA family transporter